MVQVPFNILRTYRHGDYYVDICAVDYYEAWLYHKDYGVKLFMFGCDFGAQTLAEFVAIVKSNLEDQIAIFKESFIGERS